MLPDQLAIVDVGANPIEAPPYADLAGAGYARVWGFEPNPDACARLRADAPDHVTVLDKAIGLPGEAVFNAYPASEMSSVFKLSRAAIGYLGHFKRHLGTETEMPVTLHALDDLADIPDIDLLKVDAQGAECDVVAGGQAKLSNAVAVIAEARFYKLYDDEPTLGELDKTLRDQGFVLHRFLHQKARMLGHSQRALVNNRKIGSQLIDGDAVYIRDLEDRAAVSDQQLKKLAMLATGVFHSHDLVLWCLDELAARKVVDGDLARAYIDFLPARLRA